MTYTPMNKQSKYINCIIFAMWDGEWRDAYSLLLEEKTHLHNPVTYSSYIGKKKKKSASPGIPSIRVEFLWYIIDDYLQWFLSFLRILWWSAKTRRVCWGRKPLRVCLLKPKGFSLFGGELMITCFCHIFIEPFFPSRWTLKMVKELINSQFLKLYNMNCGEQWD